MNLKEYIQHHKNELDSEKMSAKSDVVFTERLKKLHQHKKSKVVYLRFISVAASIVLVFSIVFWMQNSSNNTKRNNLIESLTAESAGERLECVYQIDEEFIKEDAIIINALLKTLIEDENANVKIATIDALLKFSTNEKVRLNLIKALEKEKTPLVQIKLIKSMSFLKENRAQKPLEEIIKNNETFPIVKNNAALAINQIKQ